MIADFSIKEFILIIGAFQGVFLSIVLFFIKKGNRNANKYLSLYILAFSFVTFSDFLNDSRLIFQLPHFYLVFDPLIFSLAPLIYFYLKNLMKHEGGRKYKLLFHLVPSIILYIMFLPIYLSNSTEKIILINEDIYSTDESINWILILCSIQILFYLYFSIKLFNKHKKYIYENLSYTEKVNLTWLKLLLSSGVILWFFFNLTIFINLDYLKDISDILFTINVYLIGFFALDQPEIFYYNISGNISKKKSIQDNPDDGKISETLIMLLLKEKIYLKNDLKLQELAERLSISTNQLSKLINEKYQKNFNEFINDFRVEELKSRLIDTQYDNLTILAIGFDCGFNSKASINSIFKKKTGHSPSNYRKLYKKN